MRGESQPSKHSPHVQADPEVEPGALGSDMVLLLDMIGFSPIYVCSERYADVSCV